LPSKQPSGLVQAVRYLKKVEGISIIELDNTDVIRHKLVKAIIESYENNK
jgi:phosphate starvation-inducible PhoH-like protein